MKSYIIRCLSEAVSPITHASGTVGNEAVIAREPVYTDRGLMHVPFLSGNAIRHRAVREPGVMWLVDRYGLRGKLSLPQLNFLLHGGNLTQSTASENTRRIADMHRLWPLLRLCGGSLPDQILSGSMDVWRGTMVCEENRNSLQGSMPYLPTDRMLSFERFVGGYQYTRGDGKKTNVARVEPAEDRPSNLMIYSGSAVNRGALFFHGFVIKHVSELELGALLMSLALWQANGGTIGGNSRLGHGRLKTTLLDNHGEGLMRAYAEYADSVKDDAVDWLNDAFTPKAELREKRRSKKAVAAEVPA